MELLSIFKQALIISFFVFVMMMLVDFVNIVAKGRISSVIQGGRWRQYILASFLGSTPGCLGAFMNVTFYVHGMISFGAIVGGMIATSGDEAFVMLIQFPEMALLLFVMLFVCGVFFALISDKVIHALGIAPCESCRESDCEQCLSDRGEMESLGGVFCLKSLMKNLISPSFTRFLLLMLIGSFLSLFIAGTLGGPDWNWKRITFICLALCALYISTVSTEHYLHDHIWGHIIKKHLFRVFLWTFGALLFIDWGLSFLNLEGYIRKNMMGVLLIGALIGIVPESGPHLIFVMMYAKGLVPFSVLFTTSFVQDGHGMLPLLSYSVKDAILIKVFNLAFGLAIGSFLFALGL